MSVCPPRTDAKLLPAAELKVATSYLLVMSAKELSNHTGTSSLRFTLPKSNILRGKRNFQKLFSEGKLIQSPKVTLRYTAYADTAAGFQVGFIAPKRMGTAVQRNRCKRLLREAFRHRQHQLKELLSETGTGLHAVLMARSANLDLPSAESSIATLMDELRTRLLSNSNPD